MSQVIFNKRINMVTTAATPSVGGYTIGYDTDGIIKQKNSAGVVTPLFSSSSQTLRQTLNLGNDSGIYSIMMGTGTSIYSSNSKSGIKLDYNGSVYIYSTFSTGTSSMTLSAEKTDIYNSYQDKYGALSISGNTYSVEVGSSLNSVSLNQTRKAFSIDHKESAASSETTIRVLEIGSSYDGDNIANKAYFHINSKGAYTNAGVRRSVIIGGIGLTASSSDTVYLGNNVNINNAYTLPSADGTSNQYLRTDGAGSVSWQSVTATTAPLDQVLAVGNSSGSYNIVMGSGTSIRSGNGASSIYLDSDSTQSKILISTDGVAKLKSYIEMDNSSLTIRATSSSIAIGNLKGLQYSADYSATFENNSLITKQYVDSQLGNVFTTYRVAYVDPAKGSDVTGIVERVDKPFASIDKAIAGLTASYSPTAIDPGMIYLKKGLYTNIAYLYSNVDYYCEPGVTFTQNGFTDTKGAANSSIFGFAKFSGTNANLVPLDITYASNVVFNFSSIDNRYVALKVTNTTGTSNVKMKGNYIYCAANFAKGILLGSNNGDSIVSSNVIIDVSEKITSAYDTITVTNGFTGTLDVSSPTIECVSDINAGPSSDAQHALSVRSASASVVINGNLIERSSGNGGGLNSAVYINAGTVSIFGNISGNECPGLYIADGAYGVISVKGDIVSKKEAIINTSNNIRFKASDGLIKTSGLGTNPYPIHINTASMSSTYLYNTRIYNSLENSGIVLMSSTSSRFGVYNSIGYSPGTASGNFIFCAGTVSVGIHNTRSNKDNSDNVEDLFAPSGFIYDQNLYLGDF